MLKIQMDLVYLDEILVVNQKRNHIYSTSHPFHRKR